MGSKIIITNYRQGISTYLFDDKKALSINIDSSNDESLLGRIYIGKVKNIVSNINAGFVEISDGKMCYLSLDKCEHPIFVKHGSASKICIGDELIVQVCKENVKTKAPVVTTEISITGKYLVLNHGKSVAAVSNKIDDPVERKRLKKILQNVLNLEYGLIARTNAIHSDETVILSELNTLRDIYERIISGGKHLTCFSMLYQPPQAFLCSIRDGFAESIDEIITDDNCIYEQVHSYLSMYQPEDLNKLHFYQNESCSLQAVYSIQSHLERALHEKVWLSCGGSLIIQPTEALTVIDVNTEKSVTSSKQVQDEFRKVNFEAAEEIAHQIRLRNLSGIIIVDFIDMEDEHNRRDLIAYMSSLVKNDPVKTNVVDMTALNLLEMTRKKIRKPLHEQMKNI